MKIVIPTLMREDRQIAYHNMPKAIQKITTIVTHSGRADILREHNPGANIHDLGKTDGIADVRQKVMDWVRSQDSKMFMLDDGCRFYTSKVLGGIRKISNTPISKESGEKDWFHLLETMEKMLEQYVQVGVSPRPGNNRHLESILSPGRAYSCYGVNVAKAHRINARFDTLYQRNNQVKLFEDFYFSLFLLTRGFPNAILYDWGFMHDHGKPGGNSLIRTNDLQKICLEALQEEFPGYVKIVQRKAKSWNIGNPEFRWECIIQWKKALTEAIHKRKIPLCK